MDKMRKFVLKVLGEKPPYIFFLFVAWFILVTPLADTKIITLLQQMGDTFKVMFSLYSGVFDPTLSMTLISALANLTGAQLALRPALLILRTIKVMQL